MSSVMIAYAVIAVVWFCIFTFLWTMDDEGGATFARLALVAPVWPAAVLVGFVVLVLALVKTATGGDR